MSDRWPIRRAAGRRWPTALPLPLLALLVGAATSVPVAIEPRDYDLFCYCDARASSPQSIVRLDSNAEILWLCRQPASRDELRTARVDFRESQLQLLTAWGLLEERSGRLATTFPILTPDQTRSLRAAMQQHARTIADQTHDDVVQLRALLRQAGRERNAFSVLFSYVLDDLVWQRFTAAGALGSRALTLERPFWNGVLWASHPPRPFSCGTNSLDSGPLTLKINWSRLPRELLKPFLADWGSVQRLFDDVAVQGRVTDPALRRLFGAYHIFDAGGQLTVPVVVEQSGDRSYERARAIAQRVASETLARLDLERWRTELGLRDRAQALVICYHELMWELLLRYEQLGAIKRPVAFAEPERAQPADIGDLILMVRHMPPARSTR